MIDLRRHRYTHFLVDSPWSLGSLDTDIRLLSANAALPSRRFWTWCIAVRDSRATIDPDRFDQNIEDCNRRLYKYDHIRYKHDHIVEPG
jgi:hypothetical protein